MRETEQEIAMNVDHLMARDVESCTPEANLSQAAMIMWRRDCGFVLSWRAPEVDSWA